MNHMCDDVASLVLGGQVHHGKYCGQHGRFQKVPGHTQQVLPTQVHYNSTVYTVIETK